MISNQILGLFTLQGIPYRGNAKMEGQPLRPYQLVLVLDLSRPALSAIEGPEPEAAPLRVAKRFSDT